MRARAPYLAALIVGAMTLLPNYAQGAPGVLDKSFGGDGKVTTHVDGSGEINDVASMGDGRLVAAGYADNRIAVARYRRDGSRDKTFSGDGWAATLVGAVASQGNAVVIQSGGKILVAGSASNGGDDDFAVVRFQSGGGLDKKFSGDGKVTTPVGPGADRAHAIALQPDGKILVAGQANNGSDQDFAVVRYRPNGALDMQFGGTGKVMLDIDGATDVANDIAVKGNGKIILGGVASVMGTSRFAVARLNPDGSPDPNFGTNGVVTTPIGSVDDGANGVAIQRDGKVLLAGYSHDGSDDDFAMVRYKANGDLDNSFGGDGKVTTAIGALRDTGVDVAVTDDGRILVAGIVRSASDDDFGLARYRPNGTLDPAFSADGKRTTDFAQDYDDPFALALHDPGRIVVAGSTLEGSDYVWALARYKGRTSRRTSLKTNEGRPRAGTRFKLSGRVRSADRLCRSRVKVRIERDVLGGRVSYKKVKILTTRRDGTFGLRRAAVRSARYRAVVRATDSCGKASATRRILVQP